MGRYAKPQAGRFPISLRRRGERLTAVGEDRVQALRLRNGSTVHPLPRDPDSGEAGEQRVGVAVAIGLEGRTARVELPAVELDDQPCLSPDGVDLVPGDRRVEPGPGRPCMRQNAGNARSQSERLGPPPASRKGTSSFVPACLGLRRTCSARAGRLRKSVWRASSMVLARLASLISGAASRIVRLGEVTAMPRW